VHRLRSRSSLAFRLLRNRRPIVFVPLTVPTSLQSCGAVGFTCMSVCHRRSGP
jgi:hypothetical protein